MKRLVSELSGKVYDVVIIGGGIFGICAAWDATSRGLSVALVEKGDFGHATSANCFKIVHGGLRYLQHGDLYRVRESSRERNVLFRIAPHLVRPLPVVVPTYGSGIQGKAVLRTAFLAYDLITFDRNRGLRHPAGRTPPGRVISREECLELFPGLERKGLTGAGIFYDGQLYSPPRLALSYLKSAINAGAEAANYLEVTGFLRNGNRILGVEALDVLSGEKLEIHAHIVLNAAGPWAPHLIRRGLGLPLHPEPTFSRDAFFVIGRQLNENLALAVQGRTRDPDALVSRGRRHLFIVPWRKYSIIGVWHVVHDGNPDEHKVTEEDLQRFLDEINDVYPALGLARKDVSQWNAGLTLFGKNEARAVDLSYGKRSQVIDHSKHHTLEGLVTMIGVRYTTSRHVAQKAIDLVFRKLGKDPPRSHTARIPLYGGRIEHFDGLLQQVLSQYGAALDPEVIRGLVSNHGSQHGDVLKYVKEDPSLAQRVGESTVIKAEVVHAVREEMSQKLGDIVLRRTDLGTGEHPGEGALRICADLVARELGWNNRRIEEEVAEVNAAFPS